MRTGIARLPSSVREFALQVCDCPMTYLPQLLLIEHMEDVDYDDGF
jgi:hypothetical protein